MDRPKVIFIGLESGVGHEMVTGLAEAGFSVHGFRTSELAVKRFGQAGGIISSSTEAVNDIGTVIIVASNSHQVDCVLLGDHGVMSGSLLARGAVIILAATLSPAYVKSLEKRISGDPRDLLLVDAPISEGASGVASTIIASGADEALARSKTILSAISKNLFTVGGGVGAASKVRMVDQMLAGVQIAAAAEAMVLGSRAGINTHVLYDIISNAAGTSCMFASRAAQMMAGDMTPRSALYVLVKDLGIALEEAKLLPFPLPLTAVSHQQFLFGSAAGYGHEADAAIVKIWEKCAGINVVSSTKEGRHRSLANEILSTAVKVGQIGFLGLGAMGFGMASTLVRKNFTVRGFDVFSLALSRFKEEGGETARSPKEAAEGAQVLIVMVANEAQATDALFGDNGAVSALPSSSTIILCSTVSPGFVRRLEERLRVENRDLHLVDAPVSGGVARAASGTLTIMAAGLDEALKRTMVVLSAMSEKLYVIEGGAGAGSSVKMVNQLLAGVHIAAAAEAIAFGARLGLNTRDLYNIICQAAGSSWMFVDRVPHMLDSDYTPRSAMNIFVKDLGIVLSEAKELKLPLYLAATAHQQFLLGAAAGWGREDDAAVVKVFETLTGVRVAAANPVITSAKLDNLSGKPEFNATHYPILSREETLKNLVPEWPDDPISHICKAEDSGIARVLVVLDDDPTGTQTVHGVTVLTEWSIEAIREEFNRCTACFFILTNSRALTVEKAYLLIEEICKNVKTAAASTGRSYTVVLRGDSTLRGHFPQEADAVTSGIGETDAWIICPFFPQGGRYTINDVHYVAEGEKLVPAGQTEFAQDAVFGYKSSNLKEWIEEKTGGRVKSEDVASVSIETIRKGGPQSVCKQLCQLSKASICIVNAATIRDIEVFSAGVIQAELLGKRFLCRSAATFVSARIGLRPKAPLTPRDLKVFDSKSGHNGGLIVVGSYVPKTTKQVEELKARCGHFLRCIVVQVPSVVSNGLSSREEVIKQTAESADAFLAAGDDTLVMSSRQLVTGNSINDNLEIHSQVSSALVEIVKKIETRPRYLLAKGGITSSDLATKAMGACKAEVVGQALMGVPLWKLGPGSRHEGIPYIVFPGNVGGSDALAEVVQTWVHPSRKSMKDLLLGAEQGRFALGAFNVYNLEGIRAVITAAETTNSPAILQVHPTALQHGEASLVACCIAAARHAKVPIAVHFDHGNQEPEILDALDLGFDSIMVDGSYLPLEKNIMLTKRIAAIAHKKGITVEAELGRLSGTEDGLSVEEYEARLTDVAQADVFLKETKVDALAVCIGNVHGKYPPGGPQLRFDLLKELYEVTRVHDVALVLHGASGLPKNIVKECIELGVRKFNVNTELRSAYMDMLLTPKKELSDVISSAKMAMQAVVEEKLQLFGSVDKAF